MKKVLLLNLPSDIPCYRILHRAKIGEPNYIWPLVDFVCLSGILHDAGFALEHKDFQVDRGASLWDFLRGKSYDAVVAAYNPFDEGYDFRLLKQIKERGHAAEVFVLASHKDRLEPGHAGTLLKENPFISALVYDYAYNSLPDLIAGAAEPRLLNILRLDGDKLTGEKAPLPDGLRLPVPRHELFRDPAYFHYDSSGGLMTAAMASFGCRMKCPFCWGPRLYQEVVTRGPENLADEMEHIAASGIEEVYFHDFSFGYHRQKLLDFCALVKKRGIKLRWFCSSRFDLMSPETIEAMAEAGCRCIEFGLESGNYGVRKLYGKNFPDEKVISILRECKKRGIHAAAFLILGLPEESLEDMRRSVAFARRAGFDYIALNILWVEPHTAISEEIKEIDASVSPLEAMKKPNFSHPTVSAEEVQALFRSEMRAIYFSPSFILGRLFSVRSWKRVRELFRLAWKLLRNRAGAAD